MELIKLKKPIKKVKKKFSKEGLKKRKESSRIQMILNNPMKKKEVREKLSLKMKGKITSQRTLFKKGNQHGKLNKGKKVSEERKIFQSMKMKGKKCSEKTKTLNKIRFLNDNPMKNAEIIKKNTLNRKLNRKEKANNKRRIASLNNINVKNNWFKSKILITPYLTEEIVIKYLSGKSLIKISKEIGMDRSTIRKIIISKSIDIRKKNDPIYHLGNNFNKNKKEVKNEKTNNLDVNSDIAVISN